MAMVDPGIIRQIQLPFRYIAYKVKARLTFYKTRYFCNILIQYSLIIYLVHDFHMGFEFL